jgi:ubiquitin-like 1-activating enzyme E1 B
MAYFAQFDVVLNALDNVDARRHVNRMCLATDRPMIDAGTTGYTGQVNVMRKGQAACYECEEKATQKVHHITPSHRRLCLAMPLSTL